MSGLHCDEYHHQAVGADKVGIRFSPNGLFSDMGSPEYREEFTHAIREAGKVRIYHQPFI